MNVEKIKEIISEEDNPCEGNLVLGIFCTDCNAQYELNTEAIAMSLITGASIWDYIQFVQSGRCRVCKKEDVLNN